LRVERAHDLRPFALGRGDESRRIGEEFLALRSVVEREKPLADDGPYIGIAGHRDPARDGIRIVAADRQPRMPFHHDPLRQAPMRRRRKNGQNRHNAGRRREAVAVLLSFLPCCGHSFDEGWKVIRIGFAET